MSVKFRVMLADKLSEKHITYPCGVEPKLDGVRALAFPPAAGVETTYHLVTRTGKQIFSPSPELLREINHLASSFPRATVFDGELVSNTGFDFNTTVGDVRRHKVNETLVYHVFDVLPVDAFPTWVHGGEHAPYALPFTTRRGALEKAFERAGLHNVRLTELTMAANRDDISTAYLRHRQAGYEGAMVKNLQGLYHPRRNRDWMKIKEHQTDDLVILDTEEGTGRLTGTLGALVCDNAGVTVRVGTGFTDELRANFWRDRDWLTGRTVEVGYQHQTNDGSLRHPTFIRLRPDKD
jgi:DNA ligase-1